MSTHHTFFIPVKIRRVFSLKNKRDKLEKGVWNKFLFKINPHVVISKMVGLTDDLQEQCDAARVRSFSDPLYFLQR
jgi:hypothetical protein